MLGTSIADEYPQQEIGCVARTVAVSIIIVAHCVQRLLKYYFRPPAPMLPLVLTLSSSLGPASTLWWVVEGGGRGAPWLCAFFVSAAWLFWSLGERQVCGSERWECEPKGRARFESQGETHNSFLKGKKGWLCSVLRIKQKRSDRDMTAPLW